jgi:glucose/arabinose dehydrogenase
VRRATTLGALAAGLALAAAAPASAHHPKGVDVDVIAKDLDNPRHVAVAKDGGVWVAEAGRGGGEEAPGKSCFDSAEGRACTGATGAITRIDRHGMHRVVTGLASFAVANPELGLGDSAIGPHGVYADGRDVYFTNGGPTGPTRNGDMNTVILRDELVEEDPVSALYGTLRKVTRHGPGRQIADIWDFERDNNPDAQVGNPLIDSNPVDVYADHGRFAVADAGGNSILGVGRFGGIRPLAIFANRDVTNPFPPPPGEPPLPPIPMQFVPTGVVRGPDGALYVSQLTGFPFPARGASVYRLDPWTGKTSVYASGFTNIMDLDFGRDGTLYVLEIDHDSLLGGTKDGALFKVPWKGKEPKPVALPPGTLTEPGGVAVGKRGRLYVSNHAREAGNGQVLRIDLG